MTLRPSGPTVSFTSARARGARAVQRTSRQNPLFQRLAIAKPHKSVPRSWENSYVLRERRWTMLADRLRNANRRQPIDAREVLEGHDGLRILDLPPVDGRESLREGEHHDLGILPFGGKAAAGGHRALGIGQTQKHGDLLRSPWGWGRWWRSGGPPPRSHSPLLREAPCWRREPPPGPAPSRPPRFPAARPSRRSPGGLPRSSPHRRGSGTAGPGRRHPASDRRAGCPPTRRVRS